jgi:hypothetical protein
VNREEIIRMAREAGFEYFCEKSPWLKGFECFAALVAAAEREACAGICEEQQNAVVKHHPARIEFDSNDFMAKKCAAAIRARGEETHALIKDLRATVHGSPFEHIGEKAQQLGQGVNK